MTYVCTWTHDMLINLGFFFFFLNLNHTLSQKKSLQEQEWKWMGLKSSEIQINKLYKIYPCSESVQIQACRRVFCSPFPEQAACECKSFSKLVV